MSAANYQLKAGGNLFKINFTSFSLDINYDIYMKHKLFCFPRIIFYIITIKLITKKSVS